MTRFLPVLCVFLFFSACRSVVDQSGLMVVNFRQGVPLKYRLVSSRQAAMSLGSSSKAGKSGPSQPQKMFETLELVIEYTPTKVDPFGLTAIEARCLSAKVSRVDFSGKSDYDDAMTRLQDKRYTLHVSPSGRIEDFTELHNLIRQIGQYAFSANTSGGRVKNPDMISDFISLQWYLWDTSSTLSDPLSGLSAGKTWQAAQFIPWPAPIPNPPARLTTFRVDNIEQQADKRIAYISSGYVLTGIPLEKFPIPYEGRFQLRGMFGFLKDYRFQSISGVGTQLFDLDRGLILSDRQRYTLTAEADFLMPLGDSKPVLTVEQELSIQLLTGP